MPKPRLRSYHRPNRKRHDRHENNHRYKNPRHTVSQLLHRCATPLRLAHQFHNLRQHRFISNAPRLHHKTSACVQRSASHVIASAFFHRHGLARQHRLIHRARAFPHNSIDRHTLPRPHTQQVTQLHGSQGNVLLLAGIVNLMRNLRRKMQQLPYRSRCLRPRAELHHLSQQHQRRDHRRCFEIYGYYAAHLRKRLWKPPWKNRRRNTFQIRRASSQSNQREHIRTAIHNRTPKSPKKRLPAPQRHRRRQNKFNPPYHRHRNPKTKSLAKHSQQQHRQTQGRTHPKPQPHRSIFRIGPNLRHHIPRLQSHPALRAAPWPNLNHLRMHRTRIPDPRLLRCRGRLPRRALLSVNSMHTLRAGRCPTQSLTMRVPDAMDSGWHIPTQILLRLFLKLRRATLRTKKILLPLKLNRRGRLLLHHTHPANWIPLHHSPNLFFSDFPRPCSFFLVPSVLLSLHSLCKKTLPNSSQPQHSCAHRCCNSINPSNSSYIASFSSFFPLPIAFAAQCRI